MAGGRRQRWRGATGGAAAFALALLLARSGPSRAGSASPPALPAVPAVPSRLEATLASGSKPFSLPVSVAVDRARREVLVADRGNRRVEIFDEDARYLRAFGQRSGGFIRFRELGGIDVEAPGRVRCADAGLGEVLTVDSVRGAVLDRAPLAPGARGAPGAQGAAGDGRGRTFVPDPAGGTVRVHDAAGALVALLGDERGLPLALERPVALAFDGRGRLLIVEAGARRVQLRALAERP